MTRLGFVGIGRMGSRMARRLIDHGYTVTVYDVNPAAVEPFRATAGGVAASLSELGQASDAVLASLPTPASVEEVVLGPGGLAEAMRPGSVFVDLSTTGVETEQRVANALAERGIEALDAPVSGGVKGAEAGTLSVMVAGKREVFEAWLPVLRVIGRNVFYVSDRPGLGQAMKLVNNLLSATALAASAEAVVLATKVGLDPKLVIDVLNVSSGRNRATEEVFPRAILSRKFDWGFALELMVKDLGLAAALARQARYPLFLGRAVEQVWELALYEGLGPEDFTTVVKVFEKMAGVELRPGTATRRGQPADRTGSEGTFRKRR